MFIQNYEGKRIIINGKTLDITNIKENDNDYVKLSLHGDIYLNRIELDYLIQLLNECKDIRVVNGKVCTVEE